MSALRFLAANRNIYAELTSKSPRDLDNQMELEDLSFSLLKTKEYSELQQT